MRMYGVGWGDGGRIGHILEHGFGLGEWQEGSNKHRSQIHLSVLLLALVKSFHQKIKKKKYTKNHNLNTFY